MMRSTPKNIIIVSSLLLGLAGCSGNHSASSTTSSTSNQQSASVVEPTATPFVDEETLSLKNEDQVIFDQNDVKIAITGYEDDGEYFIIHHSVENNSGETVIVKYINQAINGTQVSPGKIGNYVNDGETSTNADLKFSLEWIQYLGITTIHDVQYGFYIEGDDSGDEYYFENVFIEGIDDEVTPGAYSSDYLIYDENGIQVYGTKGVSVDPYDIPVTKFYIINNTDQEYYIAVSSLVLDGTEVSNSSSLHVGPYVQAQFDLNYAATSIDEKPNSWDDYQTIDITLKLIDANNTLSEVALDQFAIK